MKNYPANVISYTTIDYCCLLKTYFVIFCKSLYLFTKFHNKNLFAIGAIATLLCTLNSFLQDYRQQWHE